MRQTDESDDDDCSWRTSSSVEKEGPCIPQAPGTLQHKQPNGRSGHRKPTRKNGSAAQLTRDDLQVGADPSFVVLFRPTHARKGPMWQCNLGNCQQHNADCGRVAGSRNFRQKDVRFSVGRESCPISSLGQQ